MGRKTYLMFAIPLLAFAFIFAGYSLGNDMSPSVSDGPNWEGIVYTSTTGDFEGRVSEPHVGIDELVQVSHNVLTLTGEDGIKDMLGAGILGPAYDYIALCNASVLGAGTTCPATSNANTTLDFEFIGSGLQRAQGTYASMTDGNWMIYHTFTAGINGMVTNKTGLFNASSSGTMIAENIFTLVTLQSADTLLINWTINASDGS